MPDPEPDFAVPLAEAFRRASWRVHRPRRSDGPQPDLIVTGAGRKYVVEIKRSSEARRDRVIPLMSQAILEAQAFAKQFSEKVVPVAVVGADHFPPAVVESVHSYADRVAPQMAVGLVDSSGLRAFRGHGLEILNALPSHKANRARRQIGGRPLPQLFSDLNQWMLKILLAESIPADLLTAPRSRFKNPTELARSAGVSVMSANRFARQLENDGFFDREQDTLALAQVPELLQRWSARRDSVRELPVRWLVKRDRTAFAGLLKAHSAAAASMGHAQTGRRPLPRACLGLFAAAETLGFGFVHGVPPHIYVERLDPVVLEKWGLSLEGAEHGPDAFIRIPATPESVFRAAVLKHGVPCADILQVWLDVSEHPSRGKAQADEIARRALGPLLRKR